MKRGHYWSARAKRVGYTALTAWIVTFGLFVVHTCMLGAGAFPGGGKRVGENYQVYEHGKIYVLTPGQFWLNITLGVLMVAVLVVNIALVITFYCRGDISDEYVDGKAGS